LRVVLVIAQTDVVARRPLLDEIVLQRERLDDRISDDDLEPRGFVEKRVGFRMETPRAQIAAHPVAQRSRLADVDRLTVPVREQIHPWLLGQMGDLALEILNGHTVL